MIQISTTTAAVYTGIAVMTLVCTYITGYSRARRKSVEERDRLRAIVLDHGQLIRTWTAAYHEEQKKKVEWFSKYTALQQEIECYVHEGSHQGIQDEKPHVVDHISRGHQEWVPEESERPHVNDWNKANDGAWESLKRLHNDNHQ